MALRTWLLSWLRFSDSVGWIGGSGLVYLKMEPVLFILAYMIFLSCSRLITWVDFLVCKIRKAQMMVFTAAGNYLVNSYTCTRNKLNLAWVGRKLVCSTLIQIVRSLSKRNFFCKRKTAATKIVSLFSNNITTRTGMYGCSATIWCLWRCTLGKFNSRSSGSDSLV